MLNAVAISVIRGDLKRTQTGEMVGCRMSENESK